MTDIQVYDNFARDEYGRMMTNPGGRAYGTPRTLLNANGEALVLVGTSVFTEIIDRGSYDSFTLSCEVAAHSFTIQPRYCDTPDGTFNPQTANTQTNGFLLGGMTMTQGTRRESTPIVSGPTAVSGYTTGSIGGRYVKFLINNGTAGDPLTIIMTLATLF